MFLIIDEIQGSKMSINNDFSEYKRSVSAGYASNVAQLKSVQMPMMEMYKAVREI